MSDLDLTSEQWKQARQAGAAFTADSDEQSGGISGQQLALPGLGPEVGHTYRNVHSDQIGTVVEVTQRQYCWVRVRTNGRVSEYPLEWLTKHWRRCRPDGSWL